MSEKITLTREEFYEEVWTYPLKQLSKWYKKQPAGLMSLCARHRIPLPWPMFWANKDAYPRSDWMPLPELHNRKKGSISINLREAAPCAEASPEMQAIIEFEQRPENRVIVPADFQNQHPAILEVMNHDGSDIGIGPESPLYERALRIADALFKAMEKRGVQVVYTKAPQNPVFRFPAARFRPRPELTFSIVEETIKVQRPLSKKKHLQRGRDFRKRGYSDISLSYDIVRSGLLTICGVVTDAPRRPLEERLNEIIVKIYELAFVNNRERIKRGMVPEKPERTSEMVEQQAREEIKRDKRVDDLMEKVTRYENAKRIREYLQALEDARRPVDGPSIEWAHDYADGIDPYIRQGRPPSNEEIKEQALALGAVNAFYQETPHGTVWNVFVRQYHWTADVESAILGTPTQPSLEANLKAAVLAENLPPLRLPARDYKAIAENLIDGAQMKLINEQKKLKILPSISEWREEDDTPANPLSTDYRKFAIDAMMEFYVRLCQILDPDGVLELL